MEIEAYIQVAGGRGQGEDAVNILLQVLLKINLAFGQCQAGVTARARKNIFCLIALALTSA